MVLPGLTMCVGLNDGAAEHHRPEGDSGRAIVASIVLTTNIYLYGYDYVFMLLFVLFYC